MTIAPDPNSGPLPKRRAPLPKCKPFLKRIAHALFDQLQNVGRSEHFGGGR